MASPSNPIILNCQYTTDRPLASDTKGLCFASSSKIAFPKSYPLLVAEIARGCTLTSDRENINYEIPAHQYSAFFAAVIKLQEKNPELYLVKGSFEELLSKIVELVTELFPPVAPLKPTDIASLQARVRVM